MGDSSDDTALWLSSQVKPLVVKDMVRGDKENGRNGVEADRGFNLCFPAEFPYEFDFLSETSALTSPVESVKDYPETENSEDEDDFLAGLTNRLSQSTIRETRKLPVSSYSCACDKPEKNWGLARSPQSTLTGMESWSAGSAETGDRSPNGPSQVPSPTSTPSAVKNDNWGVFYAAAAKVARLKMNGEVPLISVYKTRGLFSHTATQVAKSPNNVMQQAQTIVQSNQQLRQISKQVRQEQIFKQKCSSIWARQAEVSWLMKQQQIQNRGQNHGYSSSHRVRTQCLPQTMLPLLRATHATQPSRYCRSAVGGVPLAGCGVKRECAGTGVFLPRQYDGTTIEPRKKTSCSTVLLPNQFVSTRYFDKEATKESWLPGGFLTEHDVMVMDRRKASHCPQSRLSRHDGAVTQDIRLPQEWTY